MVVFLLKLIFFALRFISNLVTRLIFSATAHLLLLLIHGFRAPDQGIHGTLQLVTEAIRSCSAYLVGLVIEAISAIISTFFDFLKGSVTGSAGVTSSAVVGLVEKTKTSLESFDGLLKDYAEISKGFSEMVYSIVNDMWNNYKDAFGYFTENA